MANRILRDWTDSENIDKLSFEAEVFFTRLMMKADDFGFYHANPKLLLAALFPLKNIKAETISRLLTECVETGLIFEYENNGKKYLRINNFGQRLRNMVSKFPPIVDNPPSIVRNPPPETKRNEVEVEVEVETKPKFADHGISYDLKKLSLVMQCETSWLESIAKKYKCRFEFARDKLLDFILHLETQGEEMKTLKDAKSHYSNWFRIQKDAAQRNKSTRKSGQPITDEELFNAVAKSHSFDVTNP